MDVRLCRVLFLLGGDNACEALIVRGSIVLVQDRMSVWMIAAASGESVGGPAGVELCCLSSYGSVAAL